MKPKQNYDIKKISLLLVSFNMLIMINDLPMPIVALVLSIMLFSFLIKGSTARTFFKVMFLVFAIGLIKYVFKIFLVTEAGVSLVLILSALKIWELETERDHFNMFLILALLECCLFLLTPTFLTFTLGLIKIIVFFYFILKIRNYDLTLLSGKRLLILIAPSLLFSIILFYTFPRFTQGFINTSNNQMLFSGVDSQLNFKKLGPINLSSKVVFRASGLESYSFPIPYLYWRENVLWDYYKEEWKTGYMNLKAPQPKVTNPGVKYKIQLSKDYNEFLPTLDGVSNVLENDQEYHYYSDGSFRLKNITRQNITYDVFTNSKESLTAINSLMEKKGLRLKSQQLDKIRNLIFQDKKSINQNEEEKFNSAIDYFKAKHFSYSLNPPQYSSLEDFILNGKEGYCSHFAASFAYIARSIGLPARIISGYQGGEYNPYDQTIIVRELDAHAWVEVYFKNKGWIRFDPTALVEPGRIQLGSLAFHDRVEPFIKLYNFKFPKSFLKFKWVNQFSFWLDSMNTQFTSSILNFDQEKQKEFLRSLVSKKIPIGWLFVISLAGSLPLFWLLFNWLATSRVNPYEKRYLKFIKKMRSLGLTKLEFETATSFAKRCNSVFPDMQSTIQEETEFYINAFYRHF
jgi:hypothetical protein